MRAVGSSAHAARCCAKQVLYDFGAGSTVAALLEYSSWKAKEMGKVKHFGQFEVIGVKWDATAGAETLDLLLAGVGSLLPLRVPIPRRQLPRPACFSTRQRAIRSPSPSRLSRPLVPTASYSRFQLSPHSSLALSADHFAVEANAQIGGGVDIRKHPKSMAKLKKQARHPSTSLPCPRCRNNGACNRTDGEDARPCLSDLAPPWRPSGEADERDPLRQHGVADQR